MNGIVAIVLSLCLGAGLMVVPLSAAAQAMERVPAEAEPLRASLPEVKAAILSATRYEAGAVEVSATQKDLVLTLINSDLSSRTLSARSDEAAKITGIIADSISGKPAFNNITALHMNYVTRQGRHARTVDKVDFGKDPQGRFRHHVSCASRKWATRMVDASHNSGCKTELLGVVAFSLAYLINAAS